MALLAGKQVDDEVDGVEDQPAARLEAVARVELDLVVLERFLKVVPEGLFGQIKLYFELEKRPAGAVWAGQISF